MKKTVSVITVAALMSFVSACSSLDYFDFFGSVPLPSAKNPYRPLPNSQKPAVSGSVEVTFQTHSVPGYSFEYNREISNTAYFELLKKAKEIYGNDVDVFDIVWKKGKRITDESGGWLGYEIPTTGKVITLGTRRFAGIDKALVRASSEAVKNVSKNSVIAIVYITAQDKEIINYIADELEFNLVRDEYIIADRTQLDLIRQEQNFQLSGEVDDTSAVSIGKLLGANAIITGKLEGTANLRRLRLRVLDTQTGQVLGGASEQF